MWRGATAGRNATPKFTNDRPPALRTGSSSPGGKPLTTITVGGLPGTGTSTLCRILQERLELPYTYAGQIFRDAAAARGMSLAEFGALCESDASVDRALDDQQVALMHAGDHIIEGRLSGLLAAKSGVAAIKVWLVCDHAERIRRITQRDGGDQASQASATRAREASEADRYKRYHGFDLSDLSCYDLVLDSTDTGPERLADAVCAMEGL